MRRTALAGSTVLAVSMMCLGCGAPAVDKQGVQRSADDVVTLRLGAADPGEPSLAYFVDAVDQASGGRLAVDVEKATYFSETPGGPAKLASDLRSGQVDLALIPSRDWAATGDPGFAALQAPFLVTSTLATTALAMSHVAVDLLEGMAAYDDVVGLGLVPGEPRRLLTREPVTDESDLTGKRIRVSDSDQTMALLSALGANPVQAMLAADVRLALQGGSLDGVEMAPAYVGPNAYNLAAPYLTSFALIPKFEVLAASSAAWKDLSGTDRQALIDAGAATVKWEAGRLADDEASELSLLCENGLLVVAPSPTLLDAWRGVAPAVEGARARQIMADIATHFVKVQEPDEASDLPANCPVATSATEAIGLHRAAEPSSGSSTQPTGGPTIPTGTYVVRVTAEQFAAVGQTGKDFTEDITFTWVFRADGTFEETQEPDYPDQGRQVGHYVVDGYELTMTYDPTPTGHLPAERAHWSYYEGTLTFSEIEVQDHGALPIYQNPWRKTA